MEVAHFSLGSPPPLPEASAPHCRLPEASVSRTEVPLQPRRVAMLRLPPVNTRPFMVEEAVVALRRLTDRPPAKVLVAVVEVALKVEAEMKPPATRLRVTSTRPENVDVAVVEVALNESATATPATESLA